METLSCNESTQPTAIKNTIFVEANLTNISAKFQLMASEEMILQFHLHLAFLLPWQPIKFGGLDKNNMFGRGLFKEHFCKTLVKISAVRQQ